MLEGRPITRIAVNDNGLPVKVADQAFHPLLRELKTDVINYLHSNRFQIAQGNHPYQELSSKLADGSEVDLGIRRVSSYALERNSLVVLLQPSVIPTNFLAPKGANDAEDFLLQFDIFHKIPVDDRFSFEGKKVGAIYLTSETYVQEQAIINGELPLYEKRVARNDFGNQSRLESFDGSLFPTNISDDFISNFSQAREVELERILESSGIKARVDGEARYLVDVTEVYELRATNKGKKIQATLRPYFSGEQAPISFDFGRENPYHTQTFSNGLTLTPRSSKPMYDDSPINQVEVLYAPRREQERE